MINCGKSDSSRANSFNNRSEDNSSADGSTYSVPVGQVSPKTHDSTIKVSAHVHDDQPQQIRTFQTLEASKLMKDQCFTGYLSSDGTVEEAPRSAKELDPTFIKTMECSKFSAFFSKNASECDSARSSESKTHEYSGPLCSMVKSTSSDTPMSLGTPVSSSELSAALLCASTTSLSNSGFRNRHRRVGVIEEDDLSTPYNHYSFRCLSPIDRGSTDSKSQPGNSGGRLLKRQFSLDRGDDPSSGEAAKPTAPRLHKQNSAGAAHDLEKIEEIPKVPTPSPCARRSETIPHSCSISVSVDSLSMH